MRIEPSPRSRRSSHTVTVEVGRRDRREGPRSATRRADPSGRGRRSSCRSLREMPEKEPALRDHRQLGARLPVGARDDARDRERAIVGFARALWGDVEVDLVSC